MLVEIECTYCGFKSQKQIYSKRNLSCDRCNDKKVRLKDIENERIDYYQGAPAFPEKVEEPIKELFEIQIDTPVEDKPEQSPDNQDIWDLFGFAD